MNYWKQNKKNIYVAAHRGFMGEYPENTIPSFQAALDLNVDQIEFDVRVTLDNELVVIHDATVDRTTNGKGKVCEKTLAELKALDAGSHKGEKFKGVQIPTFIECMELFSRYPELTLDIEIKEYPHVNEKAYEICDRILKIVDDYGFADRVVINSFSTSLNEYIYKTYGKKYRQHVYYPISVMAGAPTVNPYDYAYCVCMFKAFYNDLNMASPAEFAMMEELGPQAWAGACVCDERGVDMAIAAGAQLITTNYPDVVLDLLRKKGYHA